MFKIVMRPQNLLINSLVCLLFFIGIIENGFSQNLEKPIIGNACATSDIFNSFSAEFTPPASLPRETVYALQLSNKVGSFNSNTIILSRASLQGSSNVVNFEFSYPEFDGSGETLGSNTYKARIIIENQTDIFPGQTMELYAFFYDGSRLELKPERLCRLGQEIRAESEYEEYLWFRNDVLIPGETGRTLIANLPGRYFYVPNFGQCNSPSGFGTLRSDVVIVAEADGNLDITIAANGSTTICASDNVVLEINNPLPSYSYQWLKDGETIAGARNASLVIGNGNINAAGTYTLEVLDRNDVINRCTSVSNPITINLLNPSIEITSSLEEVIIPGQGITLTAEATGGLPRTITWFRVEGSTEVDIPNSNTENLVVTQAGTYGVRITATTSCSINTVTSINQVDVSTINNLNIGIDYENGSYSDCTLGSVTLQVTNISTIINGSPVLVPLNSFADSAITWFRLLPDGSSEQLTEFSGLSIDITDATGNGEYFAQIGTDASNTLDVKLNPSSFSISSSTNGFQLSTQQPTLTLSVSNPSSGSITNYRWIRLLNLAEEREESTDPTLEVFESGDYTVEITFDGCTSRIEPPISIGRESLVIPNILTPNEATNRDWDLPLQLSNQPNVGVTIYTANGEVDFSKESNYNGEWPRNSASNVNGTIYYYIITENNSPLEKGTITIIR